MIERGATKAVGEGVDQIGVERGVALRTVDEDDRRRIRVVWSLLVVEESQAVDFGEGHRSAFR